MDPAFMVVGAKTLVAAARAFVSAMRSKQGGCICPTCGHLVVAKYYRINAATVASLERLCKLYAGTQLVPVKAWGDTGPDSYHRSLLRWYDLAASPAPDHAKPFGRSGLWGPTEAGLAFLSGATAVPEYVVVDDNQKTGQADKLVTVAEARLVPYRPGDAYKVPGKAGKPDAPPTGLAAGLWG